MRYRVGVEHDDIVEVRCHRFHALDHPIDDLDEPPRRGAAALRHDEPLIEACGCADHCKGNCVLVCCYLVDEETKSNMKTPDLSLRSPGPGPRGESAVGCAC